MDPILGKETVIWNPDHMYWDSVHNVIYVNARELFLMTPSHPAEWWVKDFILHNPITERSRLFVVEKNAAPEFTRCFSASTQEDSRGLLLYMWWDSNQYARKVEDVVLYKAKVKRKNLYKK